jgi:hypothetical protein
VFYLLCALPALGQSIISVATPSAADPPVAAAGDLVTVTAGNYVPAAVYPPATSFLDLYLNNSLVASIPAQSVLTQALVRRVFTFLIPPGLATTTPTTYVIRVRATDTANQTAVTTNDPERTLTINPPPQITAVSPAVVPASSVAIVRISGASEPFIPSSTVSFSGGGITVNSVNYIDANTLDANITVAAAAAATQRDVSVISGAATVTGANKLTVGPPISIAPAAMNRGVSTALAITGFPSATPGVQVSITGDGLTAGTPAVSGGTISLPVSVAANATIGARTVTVTENRISSTGQVQISANEALLSPASGKQGSQVVLAVTGSGTNFAQGVTSVSVSGSGIAVGAISVSSPTALTVPLTIAPDAEPTARAVTISTGAQSNTATFTVISVSISLSRTSAGQGAALTLTVNGTNTSFGPGTAVQISGTGVTIGATSVVNPSQLTVPVAIDPAAPVGSRTITVVTGTEAPTA